MVAAGGRRRKSSSLWCLNTVFAQVAAGWLRLWLWWCWLLSTASSDLLRSCNSSGALTASAGFEPKQTNSKPQA